MSRTIDERVVKMTFDNKQFEQGVKQTSSSLERFKEKLSFRHVKGSFKELSNESIESFNQIKDGLDGVKVKFDHWSGAVQHVINNLTDGMLNKFTSAFNQISEVAMASLGWEKYNEKNGSVMTIMNSTGKSVEEVNDVLDELMWYSDETSYNFTQMTAALASMTTAGGDAAKLVPMIEGIANATAYAGKGANEFTRSIFNINQAYSSGLMLLKDWNSIEGAGTNSKALMETFIQVAEDMGKIKKGQVSINNFRDSLSKKWLDRDVMEKGFGAFAEFTQEVKKSVDSGQFDTATEAIKKLGEGVDTVSKKALEAAQSYKSFDDVIGAFKDAIGSQWMKTFEMIFGNFEEAKKLWTDLADSIYDVLMFKGERRNTKIFNMMADSWDLIEQKIESVGISSDDFYTRLAQSMKMTGVPVDELLKRYKTMENLVRGVGVKKGQIMTALYSFLSPINDLNTGIQTTMGTLEDFQTIVNKVIRGEFKNGKDRVEALTAAGWEYNKVQALVNKVWERNGHTWKDTTITAQDLADVMATMSSEELKMIGITEENQEKLRQLIAEGSDASTLFYDILTDATQNLPSGREMLFTAISRVIQAGVAVITQFREALAEVFPPQLGKTGRGLIELFWRLSGYLVMSEQNLTDLKDTFKIILVPIAMAKDLLSELFGLLASLLPKTDKSVKNSNKGILNFFGNIGRGLEELRAWMQDGHKYLEFFEIVGDGLSQLGEYIAGIVDEFFKMEEVQAVIQPIIDPFKRLYNWVVKVYEYFTMLRNELGYNLPDAMSKTIDLIKNDMSELFGDSMLFNFLKENGTIWYSNFREFGGFIVDGLKDGVKAGFTIIKDVMTSFAELVKETFKDHLSIHSPSRDFFDYGVYIGKGLIEGLMTVAKAIWKVVIWIAETIKAVFDSVNIVDVFSNLINGCKELIITIKDLFTSFANWLKNILDSDTSFVGKATGGIKGALQGFIDFVTSDTFKTMINALIHFGEIFVGFRIGTAIGKVSKGIMLIGKGFNRIGKGIQSLGRGYEFKNLATLVKSMAIAVAIISASMYVLSKIPTEQFNAVGDTIVKVMECLVGLVLIMRVFSTVMAWISTKQTTVEQVVQETQTQTSLLSIGLFLMSLGASMLLLISALKKTQEVIDNFDKYWPAMLVMGGVLTLLLIYVANLVKMSTRTRFTGKTEKTLFGLAATLLAVGLLLKSISTAISKLAKNIEKNKISESSFKSATYAILGALAIIGLFVVALTKFGRSNFKIGFGNAVLLISMVFMIRALASSIATLSDVSFSPASSALLISVIGIMALLAIVLEHISMLKGMTTKKVVKIFRNMALLILAIAGSLSLITFSASKIKDDTSLTALIVTCASMLGAMGLLYALLTKLTMKGIGPAKATGISKMLNSMALLLGVLVFTMAAMGTAASKIGTGYNFAALLTMVAGMMIIFQAVIKVVEILSRGLGTVKAAAISKMMNSMALLIAAMGVSMMLIGAVAADGNEDMWRNVLALCGGMTILLGAITVMSKTLLKGMGEVKAAAMMTMLTAVSLLILALSAFVTVVGIAASYTDFDWKNALALFAIASGLLAVIGGFTKVLLTGVGPAKAPVMQKVILSMIPLILAVSALIGVLGIVGSIKNFNGENLLTILLAAAAVMGGMYLLVKGFSRISSTGITLKTIFGLGAMIVALYAVIGALALFNKIKIDKNTFVGIAAALGTLLGITIILGLIGKMFNGLVISAAPVIIAIGALAAVVGILAGVFALLANTSPEKMDQFIKNVGKMCDAAKKALSKFWKWLKQKVPELLSNMINSLGKALIWIGDNFPMVIGFIFDIIGEVLEKLLLAIPKLLSSILESVTETVNSLEEKIPQAFDKLKESWEDFNDLKIHTTIFDKWYDSFNEWTSRMSYKWNMTVLDIKQGLMTTAAGIANFFKWALSGIAYDTMLILNDVLSPITEIIDAVFGTNLEEGMKEATIKLAEYKKQFRNDDGELELFKLSDEQLNEINKQREQLARDYVIEVKFSNWVEEFGEDSKEVKTVLAEVEKALQDGVQLDPEKFTWAKTMMSQIEEFGYSWDENSERIRKPIYENGKLVGETFALTTMDQISDTLKDEKETNKISNSFDDSISAAIDKTTQSKASKAAKSSHNLGVQLAYEMTYGFRETAELIDFDALGRYTTQGFANGIKDGIGNISKTASLISDAVETPVRKGLIIQSPSELMKKLGIYVDEGFINGLKEKASAIFGTSESITEKIADIFGTSDIQDSIQNALSGDFVPTVTPVVDLSNVETSIGDINSMYNGADLFNSADFNASAFNNSLNASFEASNKTDISSLVTEIRNLRKDTQNVGDEIGNMQIVLDGNRVVGVIAPKMNQTLGRMITYKGRGN